jgi:hypothetical protein
MSAHCIELALAERDPETILGPLLWLLTRIARGEADAQASGELHSALVAHCTALAAHPGVPATLRVALGGIAIEHRRHA